MVIFNYYIQKTNNLRKNGIKSISQSQNRNRNLKNNKYKKIKKVELEVNLIVMRMFRFSNSLNSLNIEYNDFDLHI